MDTVQNTNLFPLVHKISAANTANLPYFMLPYIREKKRLLDYGRGTAGSSPASSIQTSKKCQRQILQTTDIPDSPRVQNIGNIRNAQDHTIKPLFLYWGLVKNLVKPRAPGWLNQWSGQLLILAQVMISALWDQAPGWAPHWAWSQLKILPLPLLFILSLFLS